MEAEAVRTARGTAYISLQYIVTTLIGAVGFGLVARILTQTEMGIVVGLTLITGVFQILSDFGFGSGLAKYVAEYRGRNADYTLITFAGTWTKILLAGVFAFVCALSAPQLSALLLKDVAHTLFFQLLALDVFFICFFHTVNKLLLGLNKFWEIAILSVAAVGIRQLFGVGLLTFGYGLSGVIIGWILGDFTYVAIGSVVLLRGKHIRMHSPRKVIPHFRKLVRFSWPLFLTESVLFLYVWFDRTILLAFLPLSEVAVYNVAYTALTVLLTVPTTLSTTLLPYLSEQYGKDMHDKIAVGANAGARYMILIFTPVALGLMVTATPTLTLFVGEIYAEGGFILAILSLFQSIAAVGAIFSVLLLVYNMTVKVLLINIISVGISIAASFLLLPTWGLAGMAIAKGFAMVLSSALVLVAVRKHVVLKTHIEVLWKSWIASLIMTGAVWLVELVHLSRYLLPLYISVGVLVYLGALRVLKATNAGDIRLMRDLIGPKGKFVVDILGKILA